MAIINRVWALKSEERIAALERAVKAAPAKEAPVDGELRADIARLFQRVEALEGKSHVHTAGRPGKVDK